MVNIVHTREYTQSPYLKSGVMQLPMMLTFLCQIPNFWSGVLWPCDQMVAIFELHVLDPHGP